MKRIFAALFFFISLNINATDTGVGKVHLTSVITAGDAQITENATILCKPAVEGFPSNCPSPEYYDYGRKTGTTSQPTDEEFSSCGLANVCLSSILGKAGQTIPGSPAEFFSSKTDFLASFNSLSFETFSSTPTNTGVDVIDFTNFSIDALGGNTIDDIVLFQPGIIGGANTNAVGTDIGTDSLVILFKGNNINTVAFNLLSFLYGSVFSISVFDTDGLVIATRNAGISNAGTFLGIQTEKSIGKIIFTSTNSEIEALEYVYYGKTAFNQPPIANAGSNQTLECSIDGATANLDGSGSTDPNNDVLSYLWTGSFGTINGATPSVLFPLGTSNVDLSVTDTKGETATDSVSIIVQDTIAPFINAGTDIFREAISASGAPFTLNPTATDECNLTAVNVFPTPSLYSLGLTTITAIATDSSGNQSTDTVNLTVRDTIAPSIFAPSNRTVEAEGINTNVITGSATASDAVGVVSIQSNAPSTFGIGSTLVKWTARDAAGNFRNTAQIITVKDTTAPTITQPQNVSAEASGLNSNVSLITPTAIDKVGIASLTNNAPAKFSVGVTLVTWTATDIAGNTSTVTQSVTVTDSTPPSISIPLNVNIEANANLSTVTFVAPIASDIVGVSSFTNNAPATFPVGITTIVWTAVDNAGNTTTANQVITVLDTTAPTITTPVNVSIEANALNSTVVYAAPIASDIVGVSSFTSNAPANFPVGVTTIIWTAVDNAGNTTTTTQIITVFDTTAPTITTPVNVSIEANALNSTVLYSAPIAGDIVGVSSFTNNAPANFPVGITTIIWVAVDAAGNSTTVTQTITVVDTTAPLISTPINVTIEANSVNSTVVYAAPIATDIVGVATFSNNAPTTFPVGNTIITWTAIDAAGNTTFVEQTISVVDTTAPVVTAEMIYINSGDEEHDSDEGQFRLSFSASDIADPNLIITSSLEGTGCGSISIINNQVIEFEYDKEGCESEVEKGMLEIEAPNIFLTVIATDASGNSTKVIALPVGITWDNDDNDDKDSKDDD